MQNHDQGHGIIESMALLECVDIWLVRSVNKLRPPIVGISNNKNKQRKTTIHNIESSMSSRDYD